METLLSVKDVAAVLRVSTRTVWKLSSAGRLPRPVKLGGSRSVRWRRTEIDAFIQAGCDMRRLAGAVRP